MKSNWLKILLFALVISATIPAAGQTRKKKKPAVQPVAQPTVVSQADLYRDQSRQIIEGTTEVVPQPTVTPTPVPESSDEKLDRIAKGLSELAERMKSVEADSKRDYDEKQKRLLMNLDILTRAEQRSESLRKQLFEIVERESTIKTRLEQMEFEMRPEMIDRQVAFAGTLRPEELRDMRRKNLEIEKKNLQDLLLQVQSTRSNLQLNVDKSDQLVEKLRLKLEKDIDAALEQ